MIHHPGRFQTQAKELGESCRRGIPVQRSQLASAVFSNWESVPNMGKCCYWRADWSMGINPRGPEAQSGPGHLGIGGLVVCEPLVLRWLGPLEVCLAVDFPAWILGSASSRSLWGITSLPALSLEHFKTLILILFQLTFIRIVFKVVLVHQQTF